MLLRGPAMVMVRTIYMLCRLENLLPVRDWDPDQISFLRREDR